MAKSGEIVISVSLENGREILRSVLLYLPILYLLQLNITGNHLLLSLLKYLSWFARVVWKLEGAVLAGRETAVGKSAQSIGPSGWRFSAERCRWQFQCLHTSVGRVWR